MRRALVLGGGGVIGVAWESGLLSGLGSGGVPLDEISVLVGTSAGAIVGSQLLAGVLALGESRPREREAPAPIDPRNLDRNALAKILDLWGQMDGPTPRIAARIGELARALHREREAAWIKATVGSIGLTSWPTGDLRVCTVDTRSGERRVFDRSSGADIQHVVAASSAVPGLLPSVEIGGELYMDGQVHSSTNADVLLTEPPGEVLIAMPTNEGNARGMGRHAERSLEIEIKQLEAAGFQVSYRTPTREDQAQMGAHLMDPSGVPAAFRAGEATGRAWAAEL